MTASSVEPPPEAFNFAAHLLEANAGRPGKTAFIDDAGAVTYGELDDRARRFAAALKERGVKREERVLILMQDGADWPVAFLGAMLAGVVPVAVNTLLTADDLAYMLEHSRAQAAFVSGAVKPALKAALAKSDHEVHTVVVSRPAQPLDFGEIAFEDFLARAAAADEARPHACRRSRLLALFVGLDRAAEGHGAFARQPVLDDRALRQGDPGPAGERRLLLGRQALLRLWARQRADLSARASARRRCSWPSGRRRTRCSSVWRGGVGGVKPTVFYGAPTGFAGMLASNLLPKREDVALKARVLRRRSAAGRDRRALQAPFRRRHRRRHRLDRDAAHLHLQPAGQGALWHDRLAGAGLRHRTPRRGWAARLPDGEPGDLYIHGPSAALMYWGNRAKTRETFEGRWTKSGDKYIRNADGTLHLRRPLGRHAEGRRHLGEPVRGRGDARAAPVRPRSGGDRRARRRRAHQDQGVRGAEGRRLRRTRRSCKGFVKDRLAPYKYPRAIAFIAELPKTATGKIQRFRLREQEQGAGDNPKL